MRVRRPGRWTPKCYLLTPLARTHAVRASGATELVPAAGSGRGARPRSVAVQVRLQRPHGVGVEVTGTVVAGTDPALQGADGVAADLAVGVHADLALQGAGGLRAEGTV